MIRLQTWLRDPTTINGLGGAMGVIAGAVAHALTGSLGWAQVLGISTAAVVHVVLPSGSTVPSSAETLVRDAASAVFERHLAQAMPRLLADMAGALTQTAAAMSPSSASASGSGAAPSSPSPPSGVSS